MEEAAKTAKTSAETVSKSGEKLGKTGAFRAISQVGNQWGISVFTTVYSFRSVNFSINEIKQTRLVLHWEMGLLELSYQYYFSLVLERGECEEGDRRPWPNGALQTSCPTPKENRVLVQGGRGGQKGLRRQRVRECLLSPLILRERNTPLS